MTTTIKKFSTDSGVVGDGITNDSTLTLEGTATANSTVRVYDGTTLLGDGRILIVLDLHKIVGNVEDQETLHLNRC